MRAKKKHLTEKRKRFAHQYAVDLNGTQAAIRAGYAPENANREAYKLLRDPAVIAEVHKRIAAVTVKTHVTAERTLTEVSRLAYSDLTAVVKIVGGRVKILDTDSLTADQRAAIAEISETAEGIRIKTHSKDRALEFLLKYQGLLTDRLRIEGGQRLEIVEETVDVTPK